MYCFFYITKYSDSDLDIENLECKVITIPIEIENLLFRIYCSYNKSVLEEIFRKVSIEHHLEILLIHNIEKIDWIPRTESKHTILGTENDLYSDILTFLIKKLNTYNYFVHTFLPASLNNIITENKEITQELELEYLSVVVIDIEGYTSTTNSMSNKEITEYLTNFYNSSYTASRKYCNEAKIYQFIGDSVITVFSNVDNALEYSLEMLQNTKYRIRVGIATGYLYSGYVKYNSRGVWVYIGKTINLASRLEQLNKFYDTRLLFDEPTKLILSFTKESKLVDHDIPIKGFNNELFDLYTYAPKINT